MHLQCPEAMYTSHGGSEKERGIHWVRDEVSSWRSWRWTADKVPSLVLELWNKKMQSRSTGARQLQGVADRRVHDVVGHLTSLWSAAEYHHNIAPDLKVHDGESTLIGDAHSRGTEMVPLVVLASVYAYIVEIPNRSHRTSEKYPNIQRMSSGKPPAWWCREDLRQMFAS